MRFEELKVWQAARQLTQMIYAASREKPFSRDFGLTDQMRRSAISVMSNIAEGYERDGNREMRQFLSIAKGSAGELRSQLYVALDADYIDASSFAELALLAEGLSRMLSSFIAHTKSSSHSGRKHK